MQNGEWPRTLEGGHQVNVPQGSDKRIVDASRNCVGRDVLCVASADALSGIAEAVRRVTIKNARVLFMTLENLRFGYNRLFFFNTSIWSSGKMKTSVQGHEEIEVNNILLIKLKLKITLNNNLNDKIKQQPQGIHWLFMAPSISASPACKIAW